jgi:ATP-dependent RNA helicase RhlE
VTTPTFAALGLAEPLLRALSDAEYTSPTPIQAKSIPALLDGRDLLGLAETGTGKTAAFVLPLLQRIAAQGGRPQPGAPRALILAPTRELAIQIGESISAYGRHVRVSHTVIFGGVGQRPQVAAIVRGIDILVATPGRLLDLIEQRHLRLDQIRTFVLDEADRMLDMGFVRDVRRILKLVPTQRHALLFSATMPRDIAQLAAEILKNPLRVEIARAGKTVDRIDQRVMFISAGAKREALARLLQDPAMRRVIVFTRTKRGADRVCSAIEHIGIGVHAIHGNKSQGQRQAALESFRKGFTRVLIATDIAARGIDIDEITHVINYELPNIPESYVHRIGRTARAGAEGVAIALCAPDEREYLRDIERLTGRVLTVIDAPGVAERPSASEAPRAPATNGNARHNAASRAPREGASRNGTRHRERSNGNRQARRGGNAPRNEDTGHEAPQPWRNWTRDGGIYHEGSRRDRAPSRPPNKRGADRPRDGGQGRGRAAR